LPFLDNFKADTKKSKSLTKDLHKVIVIKPETASNSKSQSEETKSTTRATLPRKPTTLKEPSLTPKRALNQKIPNCHHGRRQNPPLNPTKSSK
jgi:hypothetical protein